MRKYELKVGDKEFVAEVKSLTADDAVVAINGEEFRVELKSFGLIGQPLVVQPQYTPVSSPQPARPAPPSGSPVQQAPQVPSTQAAGGGETVNSPLPGLILDIHVTENQVVKAGQTLMVMEAMKMENQVQAPHDGKVTRIRVKKGDSVAEGDALMEIARSPMSTL
jgi:biotin carboxyl carrier protein